MLAARQTLAPDRANGYEFERVIKHTNLQAKHFTQIGDFEERKDSEKEDLDGFFFGFFHNSPPQSERRTLKFQLEIDHL